MKVFNLILFIFRYIQLTKGKYIYKAADFVRANVKVLNVAHVLKMFTLSEFMLPSNLLSFYIKRYNNVPHVQFESYFFLYVIQEKTDIHPTQKGLIFGFYATALFKKKLVLYINNEKSGFKLQYRIRYNNSFSRC